MGATKWLEGIEGASFCPTPLERESTTPPLSRPKGWFGLGKLSLYAITKLSAAPPLSRLPEEEPEGKEEEETKGSGVVSFPVTTLSSWVTSSGGF